ncbi:histidine phosphatase family protein [Leucobacter sp. CSA1]|uniref:Histidine phosphatase family protein n=1 Tax=Leucobacter chromiisoli TaxID=2796471 RepID=A0A934UTF9_9MICO|nr:histidine phosphatase family protein [Leucobacter chromiisoli]MBK0418354.1 histidine phosphatase family protein [Leucobacter chromiisoli]
MTFALIRHGQTDWNLAARMQGRSDIPLNATGRDQARAAAQRLAAEGERWDVIVSSPLDRARETAAIIAEGLGIPLGSAYAGLTEQDFGEAEGLAVEEALSLWPDRRYPGMEPDAEVGLRGARAIEDVLAEHGDVRVLAVAHGTFIRRTLSEVSGHEIERFPKLENTSISTLRRLERAMEDEAAEARATGAPDLAERAEAQAERARARLWELLTVGDAPVGLALGLDADRVADPAHGPGAGRGAGPGASGEVLGRRP